MAQVAARKKRVVKPPEERRRDILDAALQLFRVRGFDETTVQDIARAADVATGTVYLYFPSKDHVLLAIHQDFHRGLEERFNQVAATLPTGAHGSGAIDFRQIIDEIIDALVEYLVETREVGEVICRYLPRSELAGEMLKDERSFIQFMASSFRAGMEHGHIHTSDPDMAAYLLSAVGNAVGDAIATGDPPELDRLVAQMKEIYRKTLAPLPERPPS